MWIIFESNRINTDEIGSYRPSRGKTVIELKSGQHKELPDCLEALDKIFLGVPTKEKQAPKRQFSGKNENLILRPAVDEAVVADLRKWAAREGLEIDQAVGSLLEFALGYK